jgi:hypothetical protein
MTCRARQGFSAVGGVAAQQAALNAKAATIKLPTIERPSLANLFMPYLPG